MALAIDFVARRRNESAHQNEWKKKVNKIEEEEEE